MSKTETVKVTLQLPKQIAEFIKDSWETDDNQKTLTEEVVKSCFSQLEADANDAGVFPEELMSKYGLLQIFKDFNVLPVYYGGPGRP
jgi:hypothetical protein